MKKLRFTLFLSFICSMGFTQNKLIDSLKHELSISKQDTSRIRLMLSICFYYRSSKIDSAIYYGQKALETANKINFLKGKVQAISYISNLYRNTGNLPKALELSFKALQLAENNLIEAETANPLSTIGNIYNELGNHSKALNYFKRVIFINEKTNQKNDVLYCLTFMNIGTQFENTNQLDSAEYYFQKSLQEYKKNKIEITPQLYWHFGNVQYKLGNMPLTLSYYRKSVQTANKINGHRFLAITFLSLSKFYEKSKQPDSSLYYAKKALTEAQIISSKSRDIVGAALQLSNLYERTNSHEALHYYKIAVAIKDSVYGANSLEAIQTIVMQEEERKKEIEVNQFKYQNKLRQYIMLTGLVVLLLIAFFLYRNNQKEKKAKNLLQEKNEEIQSALSKLKSTQTQLIHSEKLASLGELTAGIAHEIQNPLNFVNNFSELSVDLAKELKEEIKKPEKDWELIDDLTNDLTENQEKINHHGKRASSIVKGMLEHSRTSTGVKELTDINALADEYLRLAYHGLRAKDNSFNVTLETHFDENLPKIEVIPQDIGRVLLNLFNNAFYALASAASTSLSHQSDFNPKVTISTRWLSVAEAIEIRVKDNGTGMAEATKAKIFQPFFTTKPTGQGTGLGLSLAYDIITKGHGGTIEVISTEGLGSEFIITLPFKTNR